MKLYQENCDRDEIISNWDKKLLWELEKRQNVVQLFQGVLFQTSNFYTKSTGRYLLKFVNKNLDYDLNGELIMF